MITIRLNVAMGLFAVKGHAGYAPEGHDIVCAAVSTLFETLRALPYMEYMEDEDEKIVKFAIHGEEDLGPLCIDEKDASILFVPVFNAFVIGFHEIAKQYPEYVKLEI